MALVNKWPSTPNANLDNKQYNYNEQNWQTGAPITKDKLENLEVGIRILATQMQAIINEVGSDGFEAATSNSSRLDKISTEIYGSANPNYETTRSRIDKNDNKIAAIANELGGTAPDGISTAYGDTTRLDDLEKEIGGTRSSGNGYSNSRIDSLESTTSTHTDELTAIKDELGGSISGSTYEGTTRLDSVITKANSIATEIWGSNTTTGNSRIDNIETHNATIDKAIAAIKAEFGGTYVENTGFEDSELDKVISKASSIATNVWGSNITSGDSRIDNIQSWITGGKTTTYSGTNLNNRIKALENEVQGESGNYENSQIDKNKNAIAALATRADNNDTLNTEQNNRLNNLEPRVSANEKDILYDKKDISNFILELGENYDHESGFSESRIATLRNDVGANYDVDAKGSIKDRLDSIESLNTTQSNDIETLKNNRIIDRQDINTARADLTNIINEIGGSYDSIGFHNSDITTLKSDVQNIQTKNQEQDWALNAIKLELGGSFVSDEGFENSRIDDLEDGLTAANSAIRNHTSRIKRLEEAGGGGGGGGGSSATINMLHTIDTEPTDIITLSNDSLSRLANNSIVFIFLNQATLGEQDIKIQVDGIEDMFFDIFVTETKPLRATFQQGALLGIYLGAGVSAYMFNAPLAI